MKKIAVITATRAEYGLLSPVLRELRKKEDESFKTELIVTGTHLSEKYGMTVREIENGGDRIDQTIKISLNSSTALDISTNQAEVLIRFTELFERERYDAIILLGDRYETLSVAVAAGNTRTPVFHLCGGDTTEGALDEWIRHSITKISYLHFVTNEESRRRVIQLGENPERVFNYGSTSIDNILHAADLTKEEALAGIGLSDCRYALGTYHPATLSTESLYKQISAFLDAVSAFPEISFIVTKSNADLGGAKINEMLDRAEKEIPNLHIYASLGVRAYLSLMKYALFVLGNSSSGIIETPSFHVPTINIGDRQRGRLRAQSVIDCGTGKVEIITAIHKALDPDFRELCKTTVSPYGKGNAGKLIAEKSFETVSKGGIDLRKSFYDLNRGKT